MALGNNAPRSLGTIAMCSASRESCASNRHASRCGADDSAVHLLFGRLVLAFFGDGQDPRPYPAFLARHPSPDPAILSASCGPFAANRELRGGNCLRPRLAIRGLGQEVHLLLGRDALALLGYGYYALGDNGNITAPAGHYCMPPAAGGSATGADKGKAGSTATAVAVEVAKHMPWVRLPGTRPDLVEKKNVIFRIWAPPRAFHRNQSEITRPEEYSSIGRTC